MNPDSVRQAVDDDLRQLVIDTSTRVWDGVMMFTPVRTGSLRASWTMNEGRPNFNRNTGGSVSAPLSAPVMPKLSLRSPYSTVFIANGQDYVGFVNDGSDTIEAHHMIERALARV